MNYCSECGSRITDNSIFCDMCGVKLTDSTKKFRYEEPSKPKPFTEISPKERVDHSSQQKFYPSPRRRKSVLPFLIIFGASLVIIIIIIGSIIGFLFLSGSFDRSYHFLGTQPEVIIPLDNTNSSLHLNMDTNVGNIEILTENNVEDMFLGVVEVYGMKNSKLEDANRFSYKNESSKLIVEFSSEWYQSGDNPFSYNLFIILAPEIELELDIKTSTGEIFLDVFHSNISLFYLETNTGNQFIELNEIHNFSDFSPTMIANTGSIHLSLTNISYSVYSSYWGLKTSTGDLEVSLDQEIGDVNGTIDRTFVLETSTGNIDVYAKLPEFYGIYVTAIASTGSIFLPNSGDIYLSPNYSTKDWIYYFNLTASTGNIYFE